MNSQQNQSSDYDLDYSLLPFFQLSHDLLCIAGFDGYFKKVNPALCKLLEFTEDELLAKPIDSFIHPEDRKITQKQRDTLRNEKPLLNFENRYITKSGKIVWLSWTSMPVSSDELVYAIAKNVTHKKEQEEKRNQLIKKLNKTNERLKQINYTTSHDLRSPVFNLLSVFSLLDKSKIKDAETLEFIGILEKATKHLKKTLDNYLDDLQADETLQVSTEEINLHNVIDSVRDSLDSFILDSKTSFNIDLSEFETITFNRTYIESVFQNLITNSIKYAHPGREPVISIKSIKTDEKKQIIFSDNGRGFDSKKAEGKIFQRHQTFHDHKDGKGIGLYLVYNHITSLGGDISVDSKPNQGTTFTISLPG